MDYELGLRRLKQRLTETNCVDFLEFTTLEHRLKESLKREGLYGTTETLRSERAAIVSELNRLTVKNIKVTFNDLSDEGFYPKNAVVEQIVETLSQNVLDATNLLRDKGGDPGWGALLLAALSAYGEAGSYIQNWQDIAKMFGNEETLFSWVDVAAPKDIEVESTAYIVVALSGVKQRFEGRVQQCLARGLSRLRRLAEHYIMAAGEYQSFPIALILWSMVESNYDDKTFVKSLAGSLRGYLADSGVVKLSNRISTYATAFTLLSDSCYSAKFDEARSRFSSKSIEYLQSVHVPQQGFTEAPGLMGCHLSATTLSIMALLFSDVSPNDVIVTDSVSWVCQLANEGHVGESLHPTMSREQIQNSKIYGYAQALLALRLWLKAARGARLANLYPSTESKYGPKGHIPL
jgi:hypothetical protein